jgi:Transposase DDE domain
MLSTIFEQFVQMSPVSIMARGLMERIFAPDRMNQLFARHAQSYLIHSMGGEQPNPCPGYEVRIVDGTCLAATDHRLGATRLFAAKTLPGKVIAVLDPLSKLVVDIVPIEDGHAQERSKFDEVLSIVKPNQIWMGDRNFCTTKFLATIAERAAYFVLRQHGSLGWREVSELKSLGQTDTGDIFEQEVEIH